MLEQMLQKFGEKNIVFHEPARPERLWLGSNSDAFAAHVNPRALIFEGTFSFASPAMS